VMIRGPDDLLSDLGMSPALEAREAGDAAGSDAGTAGRPALPDHERIAWEALRAPATPDHIVAETELSTSHAISALLGLELRGLVVRSGGRYARSARPEEGG
jgi:predicted Rossmann fold nucleotide-binding protein DprA/Smf involved in DNA uptake